MLLKGLFQLTSLAEMDGVYSTSSVLSLASGHLQICPLHNCLLSSSFFSPTPKGLVYLQGPLGVLH